MADTPFLKPWGKFLPVYLENKAKGLEFPGVITDVSKYNEARSAHLPPLVHFLDKEVSEKVFKDAGFLIEKVEYINRKGSYPDIMLLDGKESVGLVAVKPQ